MHHSNQISNNRQLNFFCFRRSNCCNRLDSKLMKWLINNSHNRKNRAQKHWM